MDESTNAQPVAEAPAGVARKRTRKATGGGEAAIRKALADGSTLADVGRTLGYTTPTQLKAFRRRVRSGGLYVSRIGVKGNARTRADFAAKAGKHISANVKRAGKGSK